LVFDFGVGARGYFLFGPFRRGLERRRVFCFRPGAAERASLSGVAVLRHEGGRKYLEEINNDSREIPGFEKAGRRRSGGRTSTKERGHSASIRGGRRPGAQARKRKKGSKVRLSFGCFTPDDGKKRGESMRRKRGKEKGGRIRGGDLRAMLYCRRQKGKKQTNLSRTSRKREK